jgi:outer membrane protein assembly factor BamB
MQRLLRNCLAVIALAAPHPSAAGDWPQFRGPTGQGTSDATHVPTTWGRDKNIAWRTPLPGKGWSSPILHGDNIYLTTAEELPGDNGPSGDEPNNANADQRDESLRVLCLDAATGAIRWNVEAFRRPRTELKIHAKNSFASPTPLIDAGALFVHYGPNATAAFDLPGKPLWKNDGISYNPQHGGGGSPILSGKALIFNCDGTDDPFVIALNRTTGEELWRTPRPHMDSQRFAFATPLEITVAGKPQIVSPSSHGVASYDPQTGAELWRVVVPNKWSTIPRPVFHNGLVYICTGYEGPAELLAIRPDGHGDVSASHVAWRSDEFVPHTPSPLVVGGSIYMVADNGVASCRDAATGHIHWRKRLAGDFSASPIAAGGNIYFPNERGQCFVVKAATKYELVAQNDLEETTYASYAPTDHALFIRTAEALYRIADAESN